MIELPFVRNLKVNCPVAVLARDFTNVSTFAMCVLLAVLVDAASLLLNQKRNGFGLAARRRRNIISTTFVFGLPLKPFPQNT